MSIVGANDQIRKLLRSYPQQAIRQLYDFYYQPLLKISRSLTHDHEASEDIIQETFLHIWENRDRLAQDHERAIEHYLAKVVRYKSISFFKMNKYLSFSSVKFLNKQLVSQSVNPIETQIIEAEVLQEIRDYISTFPKRARECLLMRADEELSIEQICTRLKVGRKAVERSLTSANKRLKKWKPRLHL